MRFDLVIVGCMLALCACSKEKPATPDSASGSGGVVGTGGAAVPSGTGGSTAGASGAGGVVMMGGAGTGGSTMGTMGTMGTTGTGGSTMTTPDAGPGVGAEKAQLAVSADFLAKTLSIVDVDKLKDGGTRSDALVGTVDLSMYGPGPLTLAITPDGKTALVSISAGWLGSFVTIPAGGEDKVLFVDLESRSVVGEVVTGSGPMGIVITPDGKYAFVGQFGENYFALVDIEKQTSTPVPTGASFNEELAIDDTGTVAILSYGAGGDSVTFPVAAPMGGLGATVGQGGDAGGVAFFPGTKTAMVVLAPTMLTFNAGGYVVVDVTNPMSPVVTDSVSIPNSPVRYPITPVPSRNSVAFPSTIDNKLSIVEMKLEGGKAVDVQTVEVGAAETLAYGVTTAHDGRVLAAVPKEHYVAVVDLEAATSFMVPWEITESGPNDIKMIPR